MLSYLILCKSLTYAQRAVRILERHGITGSVARMPRAVSENGCTYSVKVSENKLSSALSALKNSGFPIQKVYSRDVEGNVEEVAYGLL
jgi:hypothetical protein